jgi:hypothetical protein
MMSHDDGLIIKLLQGLNAPDEMTRKNAVGALRLHGQRAAGTIPAIAQLLARERDPQVQAEAQRALAHLQQYVA